MLVGIGVMSYSFNLNATLPKPPSSSVISNAEQLFSKPLITGASVSANYGTASPGRRAALRFTSEENVSTIARGGTPGRETALRLDHSAFKGRSLIIAIDLFFWDSTLADPVRSLDALTSVIRKARSFKIPLVLGDIPELLPGRQPARAILNARIHALCQRDKGCYVWALDKLHRQVIHDGHLAIAGHNYRIDELVPDGLHLSGLASEFLADRLIELLESVPSRANR
jgi:hypothetical protein